MPLLQFCSTSVAIFTVSNEPQNLSLSKHLSQAIVADSSATDLTAELPLTLHRLLEQQSIYLALHRRLCSCTTFHKVVFDTCVVFPSVDM